jgi:hypothetical protein
VDKRNNGDLIDANELTLISIAVLVVGGLGLFVGKFMDVFWRAGIMRRLTKQEWGILGILSPDTRTIRMIVVNFSKDVIQNKGKVWIILKDRVYRHDKPERGISLTKSDLPLRWIEGIPVMYVNETSYEPIDIIGNLGEVRPEEVNSVFSSWINNQLAKMLAKILGSFKNMQTLLMITCVLSLLAAGVGYLAMQGVNNAQASVDAQGKEIHQICLKTGACVPPPVEAGGK